MQNAKIAEIENEQLRTGIPDFRVGDTVRVHYKIVEGDKDRIQVFQGVVLKRHRAGARSTFTVRKVSFNVGVERQFLSHSPRIDKVEIVSKGVVRRARLFYLRDLAGQGRPRQGREGHLKTGPLALERSRARARAAALSAGLRRWLSAALGRGGHFAEAELACRGATPRR